MSSIVHHLQSTLNGISTHQVILCGDFNMPDIDWSTLSCMSSHLPSQSLRQTVKNCALDQLVTEPTRSKNILHLVLTTNPNLIKDVQVIEQLGNGDHQMVRFDVQAKPKLVRGNPIKIYNFKKADFDLFVDLISIIPWDTCFLTDSIEDCWLRFKDLLLSAADQSIPVVTICANKKFPSWLSDDTIKLLSKKRRVFIKSKRTQSSHVIEKYKAISRKTKIATKRDHAPSAYRRYIEQHLHHPQAFLELDLEIESIGARQITDLHYQGKTLSTTTDKCSALNNNFTSVFTKEKFINT